jgi:hypothetical protein
MFYLSIESNSRFLLLVLTTTDRLTQITAGYNYLATEGTADPRFITRACASSGDSPFSFGIISRTIPPSLRFL